MKKKNKQSELKEKYKVTEIVPDNRDNLSISMDYDDDWDEVQQRFAVMLFTPDMNDTTEHWHIQLDDNQAKKLHSWLGDFLNMKGIK